MPVQISQRSNDSDLDYDLKQLYLPFFRKLIQLEHQDHNVNPV